MSGWYDQAQKKLKSGVKTGKYDRYAQVMKERVCKKLLFFCQQDAEFAQAVAQGGTFEDCMKAVAAAAKKYGNSGIPDEDAYGTAVSFYFPGAAIHMTMAIDLCGSVQGEPAEASQDSGIISLSFSDFW